MRTSGQLRKINNCEFNPNANISQNNNVLTLAVTQKKIIKRLMMGEPIPDVKAELENMLDSRGYVWENINQKESTLIVMAKKIERFVDYESSDFRSHKLFPEQVNNGNPVVVDFFGEEIEAKPDYVVEDESRIYVCKIKTGRSNNGTNDIKSNEAYCLGLYGDKMNEMREALGETKKEVVVQYLYLGDPTSNYENLTFSKAEDGRYRIPYDSPDKKYNKISECLFDNDLKKEFKEAREAEIKNHEACSPEDCAGCPMNNIHHYVEPPIPAPVSDAVRPVSDVHLSNDQRNVINYDRGIARVNAGPGAGKTLVVSLRVAELVKNGADPEKICLLTFTNAGAGEMTARATAYSAAAGVPVDPDKFTSTTFNAFCQEIIDNNYEVLGFKRKPRVVPPETQRALINRILDQFPQISSWTYGSSVQKIYNRKTSKIAFVRATDDFALIKKEGYTRDNYPAEWNRIYTSDDLDYLFMMYDEYNVQLKDKDMLEFDDHILYVKKLLEINPHLFEELGYEHIIVDEFQDTDYPQIELLQKMVDVPQFKSLMCVGDDSQSIFGFRHTSPEYMVNFSNYFGLFDDFSLVENHRSKRAIIDYANLVNDQAKVKVDKELIATKPQGEKPIVQGFYSDKQEYMWIAKQVKARWDAGERDIAVIMSDRYELAPVADALTKLGVPSTLKSPVLVTQNSRVCALTTFYDAFLGRSTQGFVDYRNIIEHGNLKTKNKEELELIADNFKNDIIDCEKTKEAFMEFAKALDVDEVDECYQDFLEKVDDCRDMDEICEFMEDFKMYGKDSTYKREGRYDGVCLTTIHSSKGLEWNTTFLCIDKLDDKKYHDRPATYEANGEYDEQIRKWFVGSTRAREELIITGKYVVSENTDSKKGVCERIYNKFLKTSYQLLGKAWDYDFMESEKVKAKEKAEAGGKDLKTRVRQALKDSNVPVFGNAGNSAPNRLSANVARALQNNVLDVKEDI